MGVTKLALFSLLTLLFGAALSANPPSPAPAIDCQSVQLGLVDCLPYVSAGNQAMKPSNSCCEGLINALKPDAAAAAKCLCQGFSDSSSLGIVLNMTNAEALPSACKVSNFSVTDQCSLGPAAAPGPAATPSSPSGAPPSASSVPATPPSASSIPGTPPSASYAPPGSPSGADAVAPNVAPSSPSSSTSSQLGAPSVELLVCAAIFAVFRTSFS